MPLKAYCLYEFVDGYGFTRKCRFLDFKACTFKNSAVRRNSVARFKQYNVAYGKVLTRYFAYLAVTQDLCCCGGHFLKSLYGLFGLALLIYAEYGINYYDEHYNDNVRWEFFLQYGGYCRYYRRGNEDDYHRVGKLREKTQYQRRFLALGKLVFAGFGRTPACLLGSETVFGAFYFAENLGRAFKIVFHFFPPCFLKKSSRFFKKKDLRQNLALPKVLLP